MLSSSFLCRFVFPLSLVPIGLASATGAQAQCLNPNLGIGTGSASDTVTLCAPLGFNFTFPNGSAHSAVSCDSNGRIFPVGADITDFSPSLAELLSDTTALCPLWTDQGGGTFDDVYCWSNGVDTATITWVDTRYNFGSVPFTVQAELHADGSFRYVYDERMRDVTFNADPVYVGFTDGNGLSSDPGPSDWSTIIGGSPISSGSSRVAYDNGRFDLSGIALDFTPNGIGGYTTTASTCGFAFVAPFGESCANAPPTSLRYTFGVFGAFNTTVGDDAMDMTPGIPMGHTDDSIRSAVLGFDIQFPDGTTTNAIDVDSNGRILPVGADGSDFTPSVGEMIGEASPHYNVFWTDLVPNATDASIDFFTNGASLATVTWRNCRQFGTLERVTVQAQLRPTALSVSGITIVFADTADFDSTKDLLIGASVGGGAADPGESDLSMDVSGFEPNIYEFFDAGVDVYDMQPVRPSPEIEFLSHPINGDVFEVLLSDMRSTHQGAFLMLGFSNLNLPLGIIGLPCTLYSDNAIPAIPIGTPGMPDALFSLSIQDVGTPLVIQGAILDPGINALGVDLTSALQAVTGN